jgi:hypothetical protein
MSLIAHPSLASPHHQSSRADIAARSVTNDRFRSSLLASVSSPIIDKDSLLKVLLRILPLANPLTTTNRRTKAEEVNINDVIDETWYYFQHLLL